MSLIIHARCLTESDRNLAEEIASTIEGAVLYLYSSSDGKFTAGGKSLYPGEILEKHQKENSCPALFLYLHHADCRRDFIKRAYSKYSGRGMMIASLNPLFRLKGEFVSIDLTGYRKDREFLSFGMTDYTLFNPEDADREFYFIERFDELHSIPKSINIQLVNACNKKCPKCLFHSEESPFSQNFNGGEMEERVLQKILSDAASMSPKPVISTSHGCEPLLYSRFEHFLAETARYGLRVNLTSNAELLTREKTDRILSSGADIATATFSLDAVKQNTYLRVQPPGNLDETERSIEYFIDKADNAGIPVELSYVYDDNNADEFEAFLNKWKDKVSMITKTDRFYIEDGAFVIEPSAANYVSTPCHILWNAMFIDYRGSVWRCGMDFEERGSSLPNVLEENTCNIWRGDKFMELRREHIDGELSGLCRKCLCFGHFNDNTAEEEDGMLVKKFYGFTTYKPLNKYHNKNTGD
ncbi:radical SAM/SPASM domain-containing protein [Limisalsivibrio acetivorans]|uniref:radical SAM/SPASM domain-containing protein n=1 Tax=Limisalsivibrio acetivorans TaxID=1304888 RepID=UPI0003B566E8|nr:radical SAM/SPASM domain-containing protein [Limisalsivibrio acetivorans]